MSIVKKAHIEIGKGRVRKRRDLFSVSILCFSRCQKFKKEKVIVAITFYLLFWV